MLKTALRFALILSLVWLLAACGFDSSDPADGDTPDGDEPDGDTPDGDEPDGDTPDGDEPDGDTPDGDEPIGEPFRFIVISDTHVRLEGKPDSGDYDPTQNQANLTHAISRINNENADADFLAITGDLVGCLYSEDPADYGIGEENPAEVFTSLITPSLLPVHAVLGNHDYQNDYDSEIGEGITTDDIEAIEAVWKKVADLDPYYSFVHEGVRFIFLNANRGDKRDIPCLGCEIEAFCTGSFDAEQLDWFETELEQGEPTIIFMHHPPLTDEDAAMFAFTPSFLVDEEDGFYDIASSYKDQIMGIFVGHGHIWEHDTLFEDIDVFETGSIGDSNGNGDNIHVIDVDPQSGIIEVTIGREGGSYWSDMM